MPSSLRYEKSSLCTVVVHFHAADKDIPKTRQFTRERALMGLQFHMAGEASQSWWKAKGKVMSYMNGSRQRESLCRETPVFKTIRSHETYSLSQEQHGKDYPLDSIISHSIIYHNTWEFKMKFGWGHSQTISFLPNLMSSHFKTNDAFSTVPQSLNSF